MNIQGLDYNTQREKLALPEFGREVQLMVDHAVSIEDRAERQRCAKSIIRIMKSMFPQYCVSDDYEHKLWDSIAIMSNFQLDIDYPYDVQQARKIAQAPKPMPYPMRNIKVRHYGNTLCQVFEKLKTMEPGPKRDALVGFTANQMKRCLVQWSQGSSDDEKVADDLARYTDGKIQINLSTFKFDKIVVNKEDVSPRKKKKRQN